MNYCDGGTEMKKESIMRMLELLKLSRIAKILGGYPTCTGFCIVPTCDDAISVGSSKIGGNPDLPPSVPWPEWKGNYLDFLMQFNLSSIPEDLRPNLLPASGRLYFFYDHESSTWGFDPKDKGSWRVLFSQEGQDALVRTQKPKGLGLGTYQTCKVEFYEAVCPHWQEVRNHPVLKNNPEAVRQFDILMEEFLTGPAHQIMGDPHAIQSSPEGMQRKCQFVSHGLYMGGSGGPPFDTAKAQELEAGAKDWRLLLQLGSDWHAGMHWGDRGRLYFWIREQDLKVKNFDDVWMILESL